MTNKEIVIAFFDQGYNFKNYENVMQLLAPNYYDHSPAAAKSAQEAVGILKLVANAFSEIKVEVLSLIEENGLVAGRFQFVAKHSGEYMNKPATGNVVSWQFLENFQIKNGKIIESWGYWPDAEILNQF